MNNSVTDGTGSVNGNNDMNGTGSVLDDAGNTIGNVVDDAANGVSEITNDILGR